MSGEIMSKWEFIAYWLDKLGYKELAEKARKIENALKELYGNTITDKWCKDYEKIYRGFETMFNEKNVYGLLRNLKHIVSLMTYCIACIYHGKDCNHCIFGKKYGCCYDEGSVFDEFINSLNKIIDEFIAKNTISTDDE